MATAARPRRTTARTPEPRLRLDQRLVLHQWALGRLGAERFDELAAWLKEPRHEGVAEDGESHFCRELVHRLQGRVGVLPPDVLRQYDANVVRHWRAVTERRARSVPGAGGALQLKYFQYLALLFTELYLDRFFGDPDRLCAALNERVQRFNADAPAGDRLALYAPAQLRKLAFWQATGSGKTLLMHVHLLQYRHYLERHGRARELNRVILLTPNEGLSRQHLAEFRLSGIDAELFVRDGASLFAGGAVEILEVSKLREESGDKTVAIDAFEGNNLVLVDEGHRGAGGETWMPARNRLAEGGFSFEYSATFGQAMRAANNARLSEEYAKCILVDYSYRWFYRDGYGKDFGIYNFAEAHGDDDELRQLYLTACLLGFYQQCRLWADRQDALRPFLLDRPLWVFVGGSVKAVRTQGGRQVSDVVDVLLFLAGFARDRARGVRRIGQVLAGAAGLRDGKGTDLFANAYPYLTQLGLSAEALFDDVLRLVLNAVTPAPLHVTLLKGTDGELALSVGGSEPFGVVNVGDAPAVLKLCAEQGDELTTSEQDVARSLFQGINDAASPVRVLLGSKKFTEGWSSWRVSTMGLLNVGVSEGSEIIQLFGRGVRLRGYEFRLKRSAAQVGDGTLDPRTHREALEWVRILETLAVFGVRANYMQQFREFLRAEGVDPDAPDVEEFVLPVVRLEGVPPLKILALPDGLDYRRDGEAPVFGEVPQALRDRPVEVDWYPRIEAEQSTGARIVAEAAPRRAVKLEARHRAFLDYDALWFDLQQVKAERGWHSLRLPRAAIASLLADGTWYDLYAPESLLRVTGHRQVRVWQEIALALLTRYAERLWTHERARWESKRLVVRELSPDDPNYPDGGAYHVAVDRSHTQVVDAIRRIEAALRAGTVTEDGGVNFRSIKFGRHLYQPLLHAVKGSPVEVRPVALNDGEADFVRDLREFYRDHAPFFATRELYLLRNRSRGRGLGFFEGGNFYPDFILWLLDEGRQRVVFVDPKGLRNVKGVKDPKIAFHAAIKDVERQVADPGLTLDSCIVSTTSYQQVAWWTGDERTFAAHHVFFRDEQRRRHIAAIFERVLGLALGGPATA